MPVYKYVSPQRFHQLEVPIPVDFEPRGGNIRSTHKWGIVSSIWSTVTKGMQACLLPLRVGVDVKPSELTQPLEEVAPTQPVEGFVNHPAGADQRIWHPMHWPEEASQHATIAQPLVRVRQERAPNAAGTSRPRSYFGWSMLVVAVVAFTVVPLVWVLAMMVF